MKKNEETNIKEAYRLVHNIHAQFQGLSNLRDALAYCVGLEDTMKVLASDVDKIKKSNAIVFEKLQKAEFKLDNAEKEYREKSEILEAEVQGRIEQLKLIEEDEKLKMNRFLEDNQSVINKIKSDTEKAEAVLKDRKTVIFKEIETINSKRKEAEQGLSDFLKKVENVVGGITNG